MTWLTLKKLRRGEEAEENGEWEMVWGLKAETQSYPFLCLLTEDNPFNCHYKWTEDFPSNKLAAFSCWVSSQLLKPLDIQLLWNPHWVEWDQIRSQGLYNRSRFPSHEKGVKNFHLRTLRIIRAKSECYR